MKGTQNTSQKLLSQTGGDMAPAPHGLNAASGSCPEHLSEWTLTPFTDPIIPISALFSIQVFLFCLLLSLLLFLPVFLSVSHWNTHKIVSASSYPTRASVTGHPCAETPCKRLVAAGGARPAPSALKAILSFGGPCLCLERRCSALSDAQRHQDVQEEGRHHPEMHQTDSRGLAFNCSRSIQRFQYDFWKKLNYPIQAKFNVSSITSTVSLNHHVFNYSTGTTEY